jgi:hypothetical protein
MLAGCPPRSYGISREFEITRMPDVACIHDAITSTKGAKDIVYREVEPQKDVFGAPTPWEYQFVYWENRPAVAFAYLTITITSDGRVIVGNRLLNTDERSAAETGAQVRPIMIELENELTTKCGAEIAPKSFTERCHLEGGCDTAS